MRTSFVKSQSEFCGIAKFDTKRKEFNMVTDVTHCHTYPDGQCQGFERSEKSRFPWGFLVALLLEMMWTA